MTRSFTSAAATAPAVPRRRQGSPVLVGRDAELAEAVSVVTAAPSVVVIEGEAGIGKTRLVAELCAHPGLAGRRFLTGSARRIREPFPLGPVLEAVRGLRGGVPADLSPVVGALRPLLPELAEQLPPDLPPLGDRQAEQHRVFRALVELLGAVGPAGLVLEDLHWADEHTLDFLAYLLGEPPAGLALVLTYRDDEVTPAVPALPSRVPAMVATARITVAPLDAAQTGALAAAILGAQRLSDEFAEYLCERASGVPFAVEELLALLRARGSLVARGNRWSRRTLDQLAVPVRIRDAVRERAGRLSAEGRGVLAAAAVLQLPVTVPVLVETSSLAESVARAGLTEALESGLLSWHGHQVGFRHVLAMQAVYDDLPPLERQERHSLAATAVACIEPVPLGQLAHHLRQAGRVEEWVAAAEQAATQAAELGDHEQAVRLLAEVLHQAPLSIVDRGRLTVQLGWAAVATVRLLDPAVADLLVAALESPGELPAAIRGQLHFLHGVQLERQGSMVARHRAMVLAVADLDDQPDVQLLAMIGSAQPIPGALAAGEHATWLERALAVIPRSDAPNLRPLGKVASMLVTVGDHRWPALTGQIRERAAEVVDAGVVHALTSVATSAGYAGHHRCADELLRMVEPLAMSLHHRRLLTLIRVIGHLLTFARGAWAGIDESSVRLREELRGDYLLQRCHVDVVVACRTLATGDSDTADTLLSDLIGAGDNPADGAVTLDVLPFPLTAYLRLALVRGEFTAVLPVLARAVAAWEAYPMLPPAVRVLPWAVAVLRAAGQPAEAAGLVRRWAGKLRGRDAPLAPAAVRLARAQLVAASGRARAAGALAASAADRYQELWCPYEAAQAHEQAATWWLSAGDERGGPALVAALAGYRELGATWDAGRAAGLARRHRVRVPAQHRGGRRSYGEELSPRERAVAELVATGRTNQEIARELYVSKKTVDKHISAALRKLGLPGRAALAHHIAGETTPATSNDGPSFP